MKKGDQRSKAPDDLARRQAGLHGDDFIIDDYIEFDQTTHHRPSHPSTPRTPRIPVVSHAIQKHLDDLRGAARACSKFSLSKETVRDLKCRAIRHRFRPEVARRIIESM